MAEIGDGRPGEGPEAGGRPGVEPPAEAEGSIAKKAVGTEETAAAVEAIGKAESRLPFGIPTIVIGSAVVVIGAAAVIWALLFGGFGGGGGGGGASAEPSGSAGPSATAPESVAPTEPGASASAGASAASSASAAASPSPSPSPADLDPPVALLVEAGVLTAAEAAAIEFDTDPTGDHVHVDPAREPDLTNPEIDIETYEVLVVDVDAAAAAALTDVGECEQFGGDVTVHCNQAEPVVAGPAYVAIVQYAGPLPEPPFDAPPLYSYDAVFGDGDPATGSQNQGNNFNAGAEVNMEVIFFRSQQGDDRGYVLLSDWREPPRSDTGQVQGNVATTGRVYAFPADGWLLFIVPQADVPEVTEYLTGAFVQDRTEQLIGIDSTAFEPIGE
jgi:hypothetical protein